MRTLPWILLLLLASGCSPTLSDDDDAVSDDDDATGDDDDATSDDDDAADDDDASGDDDDTPPPYTPGVVFSGWFGECAGECRRDMRIGESDTRVLYATSDWDDTVYVERAGILSSEGALLLSEAMQTANPSDLDAVYGCPDCSDGGARQITWDLGPAAVSSQYEWANPPPILLELVDVLVAIELEIETCLYGEYFESIPDCDPVPG